MKIIAFMAHRLFEADLEVSHSRIRHNLDPFLVQAKLAHELGLGSHIPDTEIRCQILQCPQVPSHIVGPLRLIEIELVVTYCEDEHRGRDRSEFCFRNIKCPSRGAFILGPVEDHPPTANQKKTRFIVDLFDQGVVEFTPLAINHIEREADPAGCGFSFEHPMGVVPHGPITDVAIPGGDVEDAFEVLQHHDSGREFRAARLIGDEVSQIL